VAAGSRTCGRGRPLIGCWDPDRLAQILANLLTNAIKYSPSGGEIRCRVEAAGGEVRIAVVDQGLGNPSSARPRLFEPFYRADGVIASDIPGVGLGLYLTRRLVEAHGGHMDAESAVGQGSCFTVTLPWRRPLE
jgi:signal transduction histidine kinase